VQEQQFGFMRRWRIRKLQGCVSNWINGSDERREIM
jgi:hypothetical protein